MTATLLPFRSKAERELFDPERDGQHLSDEQLALLTQGLGVELPSMEPTSEAADAAFVAVARNVSEAQRQAMRLADGLDDLADITAEVRKAIELSCAERPFRCLTILTRIERELRHMSAAFEARNAEGV